MTTTTANPTIYSAIQMFRSLLTRQEKFSWLGIVGFAFCTSILEVITASIIVVFAQVLNQPEVGQKYLVKIGFGSDLSLGRIVFIIAMITGIVYLIKNIVAGIEVFYQNFTIQRMNYNFKNKLLYKYSEADYAFTLTRNSSLGLQVVGSEAEQMFSTGMTALASMLSEGVIFVCLIGMIITMNPSLALSVFAIAVVLGFVVAKGLLPHFYRFGKKLQIAAINSNQHLLQFFHAFKEIVLLGKRDAFVSAYKVHSKRKAKTLAVQNAINALPRMVIEVLFVGLFVATVAILCYKHESPVQMIGILGGYMYAGFRLMPGLNRIINHLNLFKLSIPSIERVHSEFHTVAAKENYLNVPDFSFEKNIQFNDVSFRYINAESDALQHVSFTLEKGECIGIIGETGSGKSTLVDVLLGLLKPYQGTVMVDGEYPVQSIQWHKLIGYVPQSIYLTDDTIEANIAFGDEVIDTKKLNRVIEAAQLDKFVSQLPNGVKTFVGERGIRLSGGERQRIAIARALYAEPEVLVFDEATSALDGQTEQRLMDTIHQVSKERTVIMIAHRLSTLQKCNRILEIADGKLKNITTELHRQEA